MLQVKHNAYTGLFSLCMNPFWEHFNTLFMKFPQNDFPVSNYCTVLWILNGLDHSRKYHNIP